ncbi:MAG: helix-turn-helix transcriptional regulator [Patescibacteria group bacterium]
MTTNESKKVVEEEYSRAMLGVLVERIKEIRKAKKLTQKQLAELMGVNQPEIARIERGESAPNLSTLYKFLFAVDARLEIIY